MLLNILDIKWPMLFDRHQSLVQPFDSFIQQSCTLNKVQNLADTVVD
jgi:hypothetical protein